VICVGNATTGGAGKTPTAIALMAHLARRGIAVHSLSRGYGGCLAGPVRVDPDRHRAHEVGDEPLLLARAGPAWIGRDRRRAAVEATAAGARALVLDDGLQDPALAKDLSLLVVNGETGFGNGRVLPAGPLREPLCTAFARAQAVVMVGPDRAGLGACIPGRLPVLGARLVPVPETPSLVGRSLLAFAGIGRPAKFFSMLTALGAQVVGTRSFPDHRPYRKGEIADLKRRAEALGAQLATTAKDAMRLDPADRADLLVVEVRLIFDDADRLDRLLEPILSRA
jgi:tetraacyldisaccharide 4'-kinase